MSILAALELSLHFLGEPYDSDPTFQPTPATLFLRI